MRMLRRFLWLTPAFLLITGLFFSIALPKTVHAASTITVSSCTASALDNALTTAQASSGNTIAFTCSGDIALDQTLSITTTLTIDGSNQSVTLDGHGAMQVIVVNSGANLTLNALTIANGSTTGNGGGLANNGGTVSITNSLFTGNSVPRNQSGGAIYNTGSLTISDSTFTNTAGYFGTIYNTGNTNITSSTFANNTPSYGGGGLYNDIGGTATITNSTIANNSGDYGVGIFDNFSTTTIINSTVANNTAYGFGGGISIIGGSSGQVNISGSIVANNSGGNCQSYGTLTDNGYNLDSDSSCFTSSTSLHINPQLSGLADNGGPTQTMALQQGSPAIDVIPLSANICPSTDQRGDPRPDTATPAETACDMGAYESNYLPPDSDLSLTNIPTDMTVNATSSQGATVTYTAPTASDEGGDTSTATVNCTPSSGSVFPIGITTVTCTATDSDDSNSPVKGTFTVTVKDTDLGLSNMPANMTVNATSPNGTTVTYTAPTVIDEDSPLPTVNCTPASGSVFPIGTTTVTCTVSDSDDSPSSVSQTFTVIVLGATNQINNLITTVNNDHFKPGIQITLDAELIAARNAAQKNKTKVACAALDLFLGEVKALTGHGITSTQANVLRADAKQVQAVLGC